jgi:protein TonB
VIVSVVAVLSPVFASEEAPPAESAKGESEEPQRVSPRIILESQKPPRYPPAAKAARYTGQVWLQAVIGTDGMVGEIKVLECTRPKVGFEEAAVEAVKQWRFEPGRLGDEPAEVTLRFRLNFSPGGVSLASETIPGGTAPSTSTSSTTSFK